MGSGDVTGVVYGTCDSCVSTAIYGCTNPSATNYDSTATVDDGSCVYPPLNITVTV